MCCCSFMLPCSTATVVNCMFVLPCPELHICVGLQGSGG
jgi:hypothetical protein